MKSINVSKYFVAAMAAMLLFSLSACEQNGTSPNTTYDNDYLLVGPEFMIGSLVDGTIDQEFALQVENEKMLFKGPGERPINNNRPPIGPQKRPPLKLGMLMRVLDLTDSQKVQVNVFFDDFRDCVEAGRLALRTAQLPLIQAANAQRLAILTDLQDSVITRDQAKTLLRSVAEGLRTAMMTNQDVVAAREALKDCHDELLESIYAILTPQQIIKWNKFFRIQPVD